MFDAFKRVHKAFENRLAYSRTVRELSSLSNRELADLGIARCDIPRIARSYLR